MNRIVVVYTILLVLGVAAAATLGYLEGAKLSGNTIISTRTVTATSVVSQISTVTVPLTALETSTQYTCVDSGPPIGAALRLLNDSDFPIPGVQISGIAVGYCNNERQVQVLPVSTTNSSGWALWTQENFGNYFLSFSHFGQNWNITLPTSPTALTLATYHLISGNLTVVVCYYGDLSRCQTL